MKQKIYSHLEELRKRVIALTILFMIFLFLGMAVSGVVLERIRNDILRESTTNPLPVNLVSTTPFEYVLAQLKIGLFISLILLFPFALCHFISFMQPALEKEKKKIITIVLLALIFFCAGALFSYFIFLRIGISLLARMSSSHNILNLWSISDFVTLVFMSCLVLGLLFLLPLAMVFLAVLGIFGIKNYSSGRKAVIVAVFLLAGILTPGADVLSQVLLAVPLLVLYELGIILTALFVKKKQYLG